MSIVKYAAKNAAVNAAVTKGPWPAPSSAAQKACSALNAAGARITVAAAVNGVGAANTAPRCAVSAKRFAPIARINRRIIWVDGVKAAACAAHAVYMLNVIAAALIFAIGTEKGAPV